MPDLVGYAAKKLFSEAVTESLKADDPYYEYVRHISYKHAVWLLTKLMAAFLGRRKELLGQEC